MLLVFANKQDMAHAIKPSALTAMLGLDKLPADRKWMIQGCCGTTGDGLYEGLDWLSESLSGAVSK